MHTSRRILISPLDWGLGHASRCIPIIRELLALNAIPVLAGSGQSLDLLRMEFPELEYHKLPNLPITYPKEGSFYLHFMFRFRKMKRQIRNEHLALRDLLTKIELDAIISDNRYGLYATDVPSVLITHQLNPKLGVFSAIVSRYIHRLINHFDHCWVPDFEGIDSLAGDLSDNEQSSLKNLTHIGPLSRMNKSEPPLEKPFSILAILSGPEPHRTVLEKEITQKLANMPGNHAVVRGTFEKSHSDTNDTIKVFDVLTSSALNDLIGKSRYIISRAGFSSIMDFTQLGRNALLIPTPGQTEQEYLGRLHVGKGLFIVQNQGEINLKTALEKLNTLRPYSPKKNQDLHQILVDFLSSIY